ncbi:uncharacterized protein LOC126687622 [Mercurialis annua]|uniref:uncharacterized protein LOC126687622 n=1 Tax=Mercurialis annua TaxID=3986 RepID=UPI00215F21C5|nr:uncharacterized protein LOC126687622 [Mercurialis annua]
MPKNFAEIEKLVKGLVLPIQRLYASKAAAKYMTWHVEHEMVDRKITYGRLACPHYMEKTNAFSLASSGKQSWFDCHRKFLHVGHHYRRNDIDFQKGKCEGKGFGGDFPYWKTNVIRHNFDIMHIEKNMFVNIFNIVLNILGETKDHAKSQEELNDICDRPELAKDPAIGRFPKATCVNTTNLKMHGMKSHDFHIFMQRLLSIALHELLSREVWEPLTELSIFFRWLTSTSLTQEDLDYMELNIPKILCKLERIFPPNVFDSMEHLPVHLSYEAIMAGLVQVEGSISSEYLQEETGKFASYYFSEGDRMIHERMQRNKVCDIEIEDDVDRLSIFKPHGQPKVSVNTAVSVIKTILASNCGSLLLKVFSKASCTKGIPKSATCILKASSRVTLPPGFNNILAKGPVRLVRTFKGYHVNDFKFQTQGYGEEQLTMNSGVCLKGTQYVDNENDFYGVLTNIIELEYPALPMKTTVLFKCEWFDPTQISGTISNNKYNMVDVNNIKRYNKYKPFILAEQVDQVQYLPYSSKRKDKLN